MENYIIRIYRRDDRNPERLTGLLESVEQDTRHPFHSLSGLCDLLAPAKELDHTVRVQGVSETTN